MNSQGLVDLFRTEMADVTIPRLWTDDEVYGYADDSQKMFARLTGGIPDMTSKVTLVDLAVDQTDFTLSPLVLKVRAAHATSDGRAIAVINYENMADEGYRFDGKKGPLRALIIGADKKLAYPAPVPSVAETVQLLVDRLPLETLTAEKEEQRLEIDEHHHRHLLLWMKHLAYLKQDAETFDKSRSDDFEVRFRNYCEESAREKDRRKHKPRAVKYGGLPIGTRAQRDY